jgi:hypothetical protein
VRSPKEQRILDVFHEGRGAGKTATPGGHIIVSRKELLEKKKSYEKNSYRKASLRQEKVTGKLDHFGEE